MDGDIILTRDRSSGRIHRRVRLEGERELRTAEGDNLDEAGAYDVLDSLDDTDPADLCERCFPKAVVQGEASSVTRA